MPDVPHFVLIDKQRMTHILLNLINNAIKFTNEGAVKVCVNFKRYYINSSQHTIPKSIIKRNSAPQYNYNFTFNNLSFHKVSPEKESSSSPKNYPFRHLHTLEPNNISKSQIRMEEKKFAERSHS